LPSMPIAIATSRFVRPLPAGQLPPQPLCGGSNFCDIGVTVDSRTKRIIVVSAIDNLVKGLPDRRFRI